MRRSPARTNLFLLSTLQLASGCVLLADKADYADYRAIRLADDPGTRTLAMEAYVEKHPHGHWRDEISQARKEQELQVFESGKDTRAGLEHYLRAYPDGSFVAQARSRLKAVELIAQQQRQAAAQSEQLNQARKTRAAELRRTWVGRFLGYWVKTLVELHGWGEPIPDVARQNQQFSRAFGALPRPRCTQEECVKYYTGAFAMPVPGGNRIERNLSLMLRLRMRTGKLERAELLMPERGFSRWYELETGHAVASGDRAARATAMAWAIEHALPTIQVLGEALVAVPATPTPTLPTIEAPAIGPTGELVDTSIEAPTDPQNRARAPEEDNAGIGVQAVKPPSNSVTELVKPKAAQPAPDMTFDAVGVGKHGQRVAVDSKPAQPAADSGAATEMLFTAPLEVPKDKDKAAASLPVSGPAARAPVAEAPQPGAAGDEAVVQPLLRDYQGLGLHISVFAAGSDGSGYDGIVIERSTGKGKLAKPAPKPAAPKAAVPPAAAPQGASAGAAAPAAPKPSLPAPSAAPTP